jgi:hypothetical protein
LIENSSLKNITIEKLMNLPRRRYHNNRAEGKNEWKSLVKHYEEFDQKARMIEEFAKRAYQDRMRQDLENQISEKNSSKMTNLKGYFSY